MGPILLKRTLCIPWGGTVQTPLPPAGGRGWGPT